MAQKYMLVPLPNGIFKDYDLITRAVIGALYDRLKISNYNLMGGNEHYYDRTEEQVFCIYTHAELAAQLGVSEKTVRRSLQRLKDDNLVWWYKATYKGANRYFLHYGIDNALKSQ